jgi:hypothetical protein
MRAIYTFSKFENSKQCINYKINMVFAEGNMKETEAATKTQFDAVRAAKVGAKLLNLTFRRLGAQRRPILQGSSQQQ